MNIRVFGIDATKLEQGEKLVVFKYSVEGRDCAELVPEYYVCSGCNDILKEVSLGHDDYDLVCPRPECSEWCGIVDTIYEWNRYSKGEISKEVYEAHIALSKNPREYKLSVSTEDC